MVEPEPELVAEEVTVGQSEVPTPCTDTEMVSEEIVEEAVEQQSEAASGGGNKGAEVDGEPDILEEVLVSELDIEMDSGDEANGTASLHEDVPEEVVAVEEAEEGPGAGEAESEEEPPLEPYCETDLELESEEEEEDPETPLDSYMLGCKQTKVVPSRAFLAFLNRKDPSMTMLDLRHAGVTTPGCTAIGGALKMMGLTEINLGHNFLNDKSCEVLCKALLECPTLLKLNLSDNVLESGGAQAISNLLLGSKRIQTLDISSNHFGPKDCTGFAQAIASSESLVEFVAHHNNFGEFGGLELAKGLQDSTKITLVDLTACRFVRRSPIALANVFRGNGCLKTVKLGWNGFADLGAAAVAEALKQNDCLTELSLANNRIGETGCKALAKALEGGGNSTLTSLDLSLNPVKPGGVEAIIAAAKSNSALKYVNMEKVPVTVELAKTLAEMTTPSERLSQAMQEEEEAQIEHDVLETINTLYNDAMSVAEKAEAFQSGGEASETVCGVALARFSDWQMAQHIGGAVHDGSMKDEAAELSILAVRYGLCWRAAASAGIDSFLSAGDNRQATLAAKAAALKAGATDEEASSAAAAVGNGAVAGQVAAAFLRSALAGIAVSEQPGRIDDILPELKALLEVTRGAGFIAASRAYAEAKISNPKDKSKCAMDAQEAHKTGGGDEEYDIVGDVAEEFAVSQVAAAAAAAAEQGADVVAAANRAYKAAGGKAEAMAEDVFAAGKSDWRQEIPKAVEEAANAFKKAAKRLKMAKGDVKSYLDVDQAAGLRPDFRIVLDNGVISHAPDEADPWLVLEDYIARHKVRLLDVFKRFDLDGNGKISNEEFNKGIKDLGVDIDETRISAMLRDTDRDGDGSVSYVELCQYRQVRKLEQAKQFIEEKRQIDQMQSTEEGKVAFKDVQQGKAFVGATGGGLHVLHSSEQDQEGE